MSNESESHNPKIETQNPTAPARVFGFRLSHFGLLLLVLVAIGVGGWYAWQWFTPVAEPLALELGAIEPESAKSIEAAVAEVRKSPRSAEVWGRLGMILFANEFYPESVICCAQAERLDSKDVRWPYYQGMALHPRNPAEAIAPLTRAAALADREWLTHLRLAETHLEIALSPEAAQNYRRVLELDPANPQGLLGLGLTLFHQGDLRGSLPYLTAAAASQFTQKNSRTTLAQVYEQLGEKEKAAKALREAATMPDEPFWSDPYREKAMDLLTGPLARCFYASTLLDRQYPRRAMAIAEDILKQHPNTDQAYVILSEGSKRLGRLADAERHVRQALRLKPDAYWPTFLLGSIRYEQNDFKEAAEQFRHASRVKPGDVAAYDQLGLCQVRLGDKPGAIETWQAGLRFQPNAAPIHFHYGDFLATEGRIAEALEHLEQANRLDPNNERVAKRLAEVKAMAEKGSGGKR